jgi:NAD(P)H-flavin reductase
MRDVSKATADPARPKNLLSGTFATVTAISREFCNYTIPLIPRLKEGENNTWNDKILRTFPRLSHLPPFGYLWLIASNLSLLLAIIFFGFDIKNIRELETIGTRAGWMTVTQLPLVFLMAGKTNIVGRITGTSYERLNWIHRSVARCMFITALVHMSYFLRSWARYNYINRKLEIDIHTRRGFGAFCVLSWIVVSSLSPIRGWRYEIFVTQHMISAIGFLTIVWIHVPENAKIFVWFPVALWSFDRVVRWAFMAYHNFSIFHPKTKGNPSSLFTCKAHFHQLDDNATRITIRNPPMKWSPGQHAFVTCHSLAPFQQHPFTISSLASDGYLEFVVRAHTGCTGKIHKHACECSGLPSPAASQVDETKTVFLDGPYGRLRPLEQFDSVILISGSTGTSFTMPLLRDLLRLKALGKPLVTRKIRFIWVVRTRGQVYWFSKQLGAGLAATRKRENLEIEVSIYVTCDPELTSEISELRFELDDKSRPTSSSSTKSIVGKPKEKTDESQVEVVEEKAGCGPDGGCCCRDVVNDEDAIVEAGTGCCCSPPKTEDKEAVEPSNRLSHTSTASSVQSKFHLPETVNFISGRPMVKNLIEKEIEKARGESAVVVCGPQGLVQTAKSAVVELSDERAVHKGTGAQGVCFSAYFTVG